METTRCNSKWQPLIIKFLIAFGCAALCFNIALHVLEGAQTRILIHDNLDSSFVNLELLAKNGLLLSMKNEQIPEILGGVPAYSLGGIWGHRLLRSVFDAFTSYQLLIVLERLVAFLGMLWLIRSFLARDSEYRTPLAFAIAAAFGTLPFWPFGGLCVAGLPLVTAIIWSGIGGRIRWYGIAGLLLVTAFSLLAMSWLFYIPLAALGLGIYRLKTGAPLTKGAWIYLGIFTAFLLLTRWVEFAGAFAGAEATVRSEFPKDYRKGLGYAVMTGVTLLLRGQYHAHSLHFLLIPLSLAIPIIAARSSKKIPVIFKLSGIAILFIAFIYILFHWKPISSVENIIPFLDQLNWSRFFWLTPLLWWSVGGLSLAWIGKFFPKLFFTLTAVILVGQTFINSMYSYPIASARKNEPTFEQFFAEDLFADVRRDMQRHSRAEGKAVAFGLHPSILLFNSISTLDGYLSAGPLSKKRIWQKVLEAELAKNQPISAYIHATGRLYMFSAELQEQSGHVAPQAFRWKQFSVTNLQINTAELSKNGVEYIVAATEIGNDRQLGLKRIKTYESEKSAWRISLYQIDVPRLQ